MLHAQGHISDQELVEIHQHYCKVNGVSERVMRSDHEFARARWEALNKYRWEIEWGRFSAMLGKRVEANDFIVKISSKYGDMSAEPLTDYGPLPHIGLARPFGTWTNRCWAVALVEPAPNNRINDSCLVVGYLFITRGAVSDDIEAYAKSLVGKTYIDWRTLPEPDVAAGSVAARRSESAAHGQKGTVGKSLTHDRKLAPRLQP